MECAIKGFVSAEHWWAEYHDSEGKKFYRKIISFCWKQTLNDKIDFLSPVDSCVEDDYLNYEDFFDTKNFVKIFYDPNFHLRLCSECYICKPVDCWDEESNCTTPQ